MTTTRAGGPDQRGHVQEWHVLQRSLPTSPASVRLARMAVRVACRAWRVPGLEEPAALVASELVTTVLRHAAPGEITVLVRMTPRRFRIEVHDPSGRLPASAAATDGEDGPAALVVQATVARRGVECRRAGALLWAELPL